MRKYEETPEWWDEFRAWKANLYPTVRELVDAALGAGGHGGLGDDGWEAVIDLAELAMRASFARGERVEVVRGAVNRAVLGCSGVVERVLACGMTGLSTVIVNLDSPVVVEPISDGHQGLTELTHAPGRLCEK